MDTAAQRESEEVTQAGEGEAQDPESSEDPPTPSQGWDLEGTVVKKKAIWQTYLTQMGPGKSN